MPRRYFTIEILVLHSAVVWSWPFLGPATSRPALLCWTRTTQTCLIPGYNWWQGCVFFVGSVDLKVVFLWSVIQTTLTTQSCHIPSSCRPHRRFYFLVSWTTQSCLRPRPFAQTATCHSSLARGCYVSSQQSEYADRGSDISNFSIGRVRYKHNVFHHVCFSVKLMWLGAVLRLTAADNELRNSTIKKHSPSIMCARVKKEVCWQYSVQRMCISFMQVIHVIASVISNPYQKHEPEYYVWIKVVVIRMMECT